MNNVVIFSVSYYGRAIFRKLQKDRSNYNIVCFIDNDNAKHGSEFAKIPILPPDKLRDIDFDQILIAGRSIQDQIQQLENNLEIPKYKIRVLKKSEVAVLGNDNLNKERATIEMIEIVLKIFASNEINYWFDYSSLLALYRGDKLSDYSDVDITLISYDATEILWKELVSLNMPNIEVSKTYGKGNDSQKINKIVIKSLVDIELEEPATFDIGVKLLRDDAYVSEMDGLTSYTPVKYFSGFTIKNYHNFELRVPVNLTEYLEFIYGKDWESPAEYWATSSMGNLIK
jgi:lipopolysaccharide cholinephosphotransferase